MAIRKIITVPDSKLRQVSKPVKKIDNKIKQLVKDLIDTAQAAEEPKGVGLSAIQIKKPIRVFVIKRGNKFTPFINPQITWQSKKMLADVLEKENLILEGCLSVPGYYGFVNRPASVKMKWQDLEDKNHQEKFIEKEATFVQHELDHLNGILFVDHVLKQGGKIYKLEKDKQGKEIFVEVEIEP
ncbi:MAG: peptide deformylase [Candidatus Marinimicrobia bacterium]|nr:peptide deformylase [Candidatus Neomarinimicrobiota bacterium]